MPSVIETSNGDFIGIRKKIIISHSYDHRVINGVYALKFLTKLMQYLDDVKFLESSFE